MILDDSIMQEAEERAEKLLAFRTVEDQWTVFEELIAEAAAKQRDHAIHETTITMVRDRLYPKVSRQQWQKLGWSKVLGGGASIASFIHRLRLALAAGSSTGKL